MNIYTVVLHEKRIKLGLSINEYCVCDSIYHLSTNPKSKVSGWANITQETLAKVLGLTERTVLEIIKRLVAQNLVETRGHLKRTTSLWFETVVSKSEETSVFEETQKSEETSPQKVKKLHLKSEETSPYNNNSNNDIKECAENPLFKEFWDQYPKRKRDREKCLTSFEKLPLKVQEEVVNDVKERKTKHWDWVKENHQFVPAPLVYLRNKRWEEKIDGQGKVSNVFHNAKVEKQKVSLEKIAV